MFVDVPKKLRASFVEPENYDEFAGRLSNLEKSMRRIETMLSRIVPSVEEAVDDDDELDESGTLRGDGLTAESSFRD